MVVATWSEKLPLWMQQSNPVFIFQKSITVPGPPCWRLVCYTLYWTWQVLTIFQIVHNVLFLHFFVVEVKSFVQRPSVLAFFLTLFPLYSGSEELKRMAHSKARAADGKVTYPPGVKEISDKISKEEMVRRLKVSHVLSLCLKGICICWLCGWTCLGRRRKAAWYHSVTSLEAQYHFYFIQPSQPLTSCYSISPTVPHPSGRWLWRPSWTWTRTLRKRRSCTWTWPSIWPQTSSSNTQTRMCVCWWPAVWQTYSGFMPRRRPTPPRINSRYSGDLAVADEAI